MTRVAPVSSKSAGIHYTPPELAAWLAELVLGHLEPRPGGVLRVLDPACGEGALLEAVARALPRPGRGELELTGHETDPTARAQAAARLAEASPLGLTLHGRDFLAQPVAGFDLVVANPPFVRTQVLGAQRAGELSRRFGLSGRVDLYQAFVSALAGAIRPGGVLGLIAPNRLLSTRDSGGLRELLARAFEPRLIVDLGDTRLFAAAVLPMLMVAVRRDKAGAPSPSGCPFARVHEVREPAAAVERSRSSVVEALREGVEGRFQAGGRTFQVERGTLAAAPDRGPWSLRSSRDQAWLERLDARRRGTLASLGGPVRVGIKTTADRVFVRDDWASLDPAIRPEPELLRPLLTHREAERWRRHVASTRYRVLYTHTVREGRREPIDLEAYPGARAYLEAHRGVLEGRDYVRRAGRRWYEIWVPHDPGSWDRPKLVFPDIAEHPRAFLDTSGAVVQGDCYWMAFDPAQGIDALLLCLAVLNSSLATAYYDARFHNKLYAGRRRFLTQYVAEFPVPDPSHAASRAVVEEVRGLIDPAGKLVVEGDAAERELDRLVWLAFGLTPPGPLGEPPQPC